MTTLPIHPVAGPIDGVVRPPGSKSITNRALVAAALARRDSVSRLDGALEADDTVRMREGLRTLGIMIDDVDDPWLVLGGGGTVTGGVTIDAGASGTTARFLTAVGALADTPVEVDGTARMRERPIGDLLDALTGLGARVESTGGFPPLRVSGPPHGGTTSVSGAVSSQFLSALLLIAPVLDGPTTIEVVDDLVSGPYVAGTLEVMRAFGAEVEAVGAHYRVQPTGYRKAHFDVEADASAAVYPAIAVAVVGGRVVIPGIPVSSIQPDLAVLAVLEEMGCRIVRGPDSIRVEADGAPLAPIDVDMSHAPDGALGVAVACLFAAGPSRISGLGTLRVKETDRLQALATELAKLGATTSIEGDTLVVAPGTPRGARIATYDDHRMAMSFALAGLRIPGVEIEDPECVTKTWPRYFTALDELCGR